MDKKTALIAVLTIALGIATFFALRANKIQNNQSDSSYLEQVNPALRMAYDESTRDSAIVDIAEISCLPTSRFDCGSGGCTPTTPASYFLVDYGTENGTYFRCDSKGCDSYPVKVNQSGEFTQLTPLEGQAMLFKVATGDSLGNRGEFIDIATFGTGAIISEGKCEFKKRLK